MAHQIAQREDGKIIIKAKVEQFVDEIQIVRHKKNWVGTSIPIDDDLTKEEADTQFSLRQKAR